MEASAEDVNEFSKFVYRFRAEQHPRFSTHSLKRVTDKGISNDAFYMIDMPYIFKSGCVELTVSPGIPAAGSLVVVAQLSGSRTWQPRPNESRDTGFFESISKYLKYA